MGARAIANRNISSSARAVEPGFAASQPALNVGPDADVVSGENVSVQPPANSIIYTWTVMNFGDVGLKNAINDFINTTKEGVRVTPDLLLGREKTLIFNFYSLMGKSIKPGEIGQFEVNFSYPPSVIPTPNTNSQQQNNSQ